MNCFGRLTPERRAAVAQVYVTSRNGGAGDGQAADLAFAELTDAEKDASGVYPSAHPPDALSKASQPPPPLVRAAR